MRSRRPRTGPKPHDARACSISRSESLSVRRKILAIVHSLPEADAVPRGRHLSLEVRGRRFAWFLDDHHGDGRLAIRGRASESLRASLTTDAPRQVHASANVGDSGWLGMWLDVPLVPWSVVRKLLVDGYVLSAPKSLSLQLARKAEPHVASAQAREALPQPR